MEAELKIILPKVSKCVWNLSGTILKATHHGYLDSKTYFKFATKINECDGSKIQVTVKDFVHIFEGKKKVKQVAQILDLWEEYHGLRYATVRILKRLLVDLKSRQFQTLVIYLLQYIPFHKWNDVSTSDTYAELQFLKAISSVAVKDDEDSFNNVLHERELFRTKNQVVIDLNNVIESVRVYNKILKYPGLDENEYVMRCDWDENKKTFRVLSTIEDQIYRLYEGKIRVGSKFQVDISKDAAADDVVTQCKLQATSAAENTAPEVTDAIKYNKVWQPLHEDQMSSLQEFLVAARERERLLEGMVVKFKTCKQTWGRICFNPLSYDPWSKLDSLRDFINVTVEGEDVLVPRSNVVGHFRADIALNVLFQHGNNFQEALEHLTSPEFYYNADMHWSEEACQNMCKLQNIASRKKDQETNSVSWEMDLDGPRENLNIVFLKENAQKVVDNTKSAQSIIDFTLQCPLPRERMRKATSKDIKGFSKIVRILRVALTPNEYENWARVTSETASMRLDSDSTLERSLDSIRHRPDLQDLVVKLLLL